MKNAIWITWENQVRNKSMAAALEVPVYAIDLNGNRLVRYLISSIETVILLFKNRPKVVFTQNPSIVLNYLLLILRPFLKYKLICDLHFIGVVTCNGNRLLQKALNLVNRNADAVIVTNMDHKRYVEMIGGSAFICQDPLPDISKYFLPVNENEKKVFFICSYDPDEPYRIAFEAAELLWEKGYRFYVSGNYHKACIDPRNYPHINFLGYINTLDYYSHLFESQVILDLTEFDNCLVCGAYEAMAAERPFVTSKHLALKEYFHKGTVFTEHSPESIAEAVQCAYENRSALRVEIENWKKDATINLSGRIKEIKNFAFDT